MDRADSLVIQEYQAFLDILVFQVLAYLVFLDSVQVLDSQDIQVSVVIPDLVVLEHLVFPALVHLQVSLDIHLLSLVLPASQDIPASQESAPLDFQVLAQHLVLVDTLALMDKVDSLVNLASRVWVHLVSLDLVQVLVSQDIHLLLQVLLALADIQDLKEHQASQALALHLVSVDTQV